MGWSTPDDIAAKVRARWSSGALLRAHGRGEPFPVLDVPLRGPTAVQVGEDLDGARAWAARLERSAPGRYRLVTRSVGGRAIGRTSLPGRAVIETFEQAWRVLGVEAEVTAFEEVLALSTEERARSWVLDRPLQALALRQEWPAILAASAWLGAGSGRGRYLREISAPGVDTKLVERHRPVLAALLEVPVRAGEFLAALGLRTVPARLRLRCDTEFAGLPRSISEVALRVDELARMRVSVQQVVVVENEVTFLSAPIPPEGLVVFGAGYRASWLGDVPWLQDAAVHYWGDLDTHGFAILDQLRGVLPQTASFLMDLETLVEHRDRWVREQTPTRALASRLTAGEREVQEGLLTDRWGERVRLEQERVDWQWALARWPVE